VIDGRHIVVRQRRGGERLGHAGATCQVERGRCRMICRKFAIPPRGIAIDPVSGKIFVCDTNNNRALRFGAAYGRTAAYPSAASSAAHGSVTTHESAI
jgi:DNA-binding beta-propeller fold protein YncE